MDYLVNLSNSTSNTNRVISGQHVSYYLQRNDFTNGFQQNIIDLQTQTGKFVAMIKSDYEIEASS